MLTSAVMVTSNSEIFSTSVFCITDFSPFSPYSKKTTKEQSKRCLTWPFRQSHPCGNAGMNGTVDTPALLTL